jgi:hypothetical protein
LLEEFGCRKLHGSFKLLVVCARDVIPSLGVTPMMVVDAAIPIE